MKTPVAGRGTTGTGPSPSWRPAAGTAEDPMAWRDRGARLYAAGDRAGAAEAYMRYLAAPPRDPALRAAEEALAADRLKAAEGQVRAFLARQPNDPAGYNLLGRIALAAQDNATAEAVFRRLLDLVPGSLPIRHDLAAALLPQGKVAEALVELDRLLAARPADVPARILRAEALAKQGDFAAAAALHEALVAARPGDPALWLGLGHMLRTLRRRDEAVAAFRRAIAIAPAFGEAWWNLANMKTGTLTAADVATLRALLAKGDGDAGAGADARGGPSATDRYHLRFALARALEEAGAFGPSFAEYRAANAARLALLPPPAGPGVAGVAEQVKALFTAGFLAARAGAGAPSTDPIFILGMPRSGSTLLEQILASHPAIEGTQELADLPLIAAELDRSNSARGAYPAVLAALPPDRLRALGERYLARAATKRKTDRAHFIDKLPANWLHVGLIRLILPNARIIDMRRDALGCCLSMFRQHFGRGAAFTYSPERLAADYRAYHGLMAHFDAVAPGAVRRVALAGLVADLEGTVRALLDHLGLPFAEECLRFHDSARAVFTPSSEQVRRPINDEAAALLAGFRPHVGALAALLHGLDDPGPATAGAPA